MLGCVAAHVTSPHPPALAVASTALAGFALVTGAHGAPKGGEQAPVDLSMFTDNVVVPLFGELGLVGSHKHRTAKAARPFALLRSSLWHLFCLFSFSTPRAALATSGCTARSSPSSACTPRPWSDPACPEKLCAQQSWPIAISLSRGETATTCLSAHCPDKCLWLPRAFFSAAKQLHVHKQEVQPD